MTGAQEDAVTAEAPMTPVPQAAGEAAPEHTIVDNEMVARLSRQSRPLWRRIARIALGVTLIVVGVAEAVLPGPAIVFFALGFSLLAPDVPPIRRALVALYRRWPKLRRAVPRRFRRTTHKNGDAES